jgi:glycosyltransferase involved in cell wall biosynthesis
MQKPLVTCIIPAFNGERYIESAIESVLNQTFKNIEIIIIDDGSTDNTPNLIEKFNGKIRYIRQSNSGSAVARNLGISKASGDFIGFLDSDDMWDKNKILFQLECFENNPGIEACLCNIKILNEKEKGILDDQYVIVTPYTVCSILIKTETVKKVGYFNVNLKFGEDTDWFMRIRKLDIPVKILKDTLVYARLHKDNLTNSFNVRSRDEIFSKIKNKLDERRNKII